MCVHRINVHTVNIYIYIFSCLQDIHIYAEYVYILNMYINYIYTMNTCMYTIYYIEMQLYTIVLGNRFQHGMVCMQFYLDSVQ